MEKFNGEDVSRYISCYLLPNHLRTDKGVVLKTMAKSPFVEAFYLFRSLHESLKNDTDVVMEAMMGIYMRYDSLPEQWKNNKATVIKTIKCTRQFFDSLPEHLRKEKDVVIMAMKCMYPPFDVLPERLKKDKDVVVTALNQERRLRKVFVERWSFMPDGLGSMLDELHDVPDVLRDDKDVAILVTEMFCSGFDWVSVRLHDDEDVVMEAMKRNNKSFENASNRLRDDETIAIHAVGLSFDNVAFVSKRLRDDLTFMTSTLANSRGISRSGPLLRWASPRLQSHKEFVLANISSQGGSCFEYARNDLRSDIDVVMAAVATCPLAFRYVSPALKSNKRVAIAAMTKCQPATLFRSFAVSLKKDIDVCLAAISRNLCALPYMADEVKQDRRIVMQAMSLRGESLRGFPLFRNDLQICIAAVANSKYAFEFVADEFKTSREFFTGVVLKRFDTISLAPRNIKQDLEIIYQALTNAPRNPNSDDMALAHRCFGYIFDRIARLNRKLENKGDFLLSGILCHVDRNSSSKRLKRTTGTIDVKKWDHDHCEKMWLVNYLSQHDKWSGQTPAHSLVMEYAGLNDSKNTHNKVRTEVFLCEKIINRMIELNWTMPTNVR